MWLAISLVSCNHNKRIDEATKIYKAWAGKKIEFPEQVRCIACGSDTCCISTYSNRYKVLLYVSSEGCTSCKLQAAEWKKFITEVDTTFPGKVDFHTYLLLNKITSL